MMYLQCFIYNINPDARNIIGYYNNKNVPGITLGFAQENIKHEQLNNVLKMFVNFSYCRFLHKFLLAANVLFIKHSGAFSCNRLQNKQKKQFCFISECFVTLCMTTKECGYCITAESSECLSFRMRMTRRFY